MSIHLLSIGILVLLFVIAIIRPVNMGAMAFVAAFGVGTFAFGESADDIVSGFPADLFVVLVGVTYLFAITQANGTVDWLLRSTMRLTERRTALIPWAFFLLSGLLCGIGAVGPAVVAILMPVAMSFATAHGVRPLMIGVMISMGATAGSFSPIGIFGLIVRDVMQRNALPFDAGLLFGMTFAAGTVLGAATFMIFGGLSLPASRRPAATVAGDGRVEGPGAATAPGPDVPETSTTTERPRLDTERSLTLAGFGLLVVGAIGFELDVGFLALAVAVLLTLLYPESGRAAVGRISWSVVLLISGVVTFVGVMERSGAIQWLGESVTGVGQPLLAGLLVCLIGAVVSAFASTTGILGALIPLAVPLIMAGAIGPIGLVIALSISSSVVDTSPFSTNGAIILANAPEAERERLYQALLGVGLAMIVVGPLLSWALLVVPGWL